ncbi:HU family DNA-binding protein [Cognatiyoonia sp. IB215182]|uniref:HU family DNA-binding protein n=1 Tax=Cognatiyoonia sp. IB215182 TaxID=3097353 RepID=UPI002A115EE9|nr:HU family DNA-binding protein [Cognatiyoonia sp. IB215182]MDX8353318.1 HU family DNA-binding protein [Cognatiyoonia sp. IB215182]
MTDETSPLKKPDLLDQVVARTNLKKRDVKPAVEAALSVIADALAHGGEVALPPLGKLRIVKSKELSEGARVLTLKLRMPKDASRHATTDLAEDSEDG